MKVEVVSYKSEWPAIFEEEAAHIAKILGQNLVRIFHIGSTSVENLQAKPIIDMLPIVRDLDLVDSMNHEFEALGYEPMGELGIPGRRYFRKGGDNRTHQIHAFRYDNIYAIERHIAFRDYLCAHPDVRDEYGILKATLAEKFPTDIEGYMEGKDAFVKKVEADAILWRWQIR